MNAAFVDRHGAPATYASLQKALAGVSVEVGWPVVVCRGKHAGKSGKVTLVEYSCVRLLEDITDIEVFIFKCIRLSILTKYSLAGSQKGQR